MPKLKTSRRAFLSASAASAFSFTFLPRHVLGGVGQIPPSERLNVAGIGCGGMGGGDIAKLTSLGANFVALCDVDEARAAGTFKAHPNARLKSRATMASHSKAIGSLRVPSKPTRSG